MFGRVTCWSWSRDQPPSRADRGSSAVCCDVPFPELMAAMLRSVGAAASKRPWGLSARVVLLLLLLPLPPPLNSGEGRRTFPWPAPPPRDLGWAHTSPWASTPLPQGVAGIFHFPVLSAFSTPALLAPVDTCGPAFPPHAARGDTRPKAPISRVSASTAASPHSLPELPRQLDPAESCRLA